MHRFVRILCASFLFVVAGCSEHLALSVSGSDVDLGRNADSNVIRLERGQVVVVLAQIIHPEIEGSTVFKVEEMRADDPSIVLVSPAGNGLFAIEPKAEGETVLRASIDGDERGAAPIRVLPPKP